MDRIKISREFRDSILGSLWLGIERDVVAGSDLTTHFELANKELAAAFKELVPVVRYGTAGPTVGATHKNDTEILYNDETGEITDPKEKRRQEVIDGLITAIGMANSLKATEWFRPRVEAANDEKLTEAFNKKMEEFV